MRIDERFSGHCGPQHLLQFTNQHRVQLQETTGCLTWYTASICAVDRHIVRGQAGRSCHERQCSNEHCVFRTGGGLRQAHDALPSTHICSNPADLVFLHQELPSSTPSIASNPKAVSLDSVPARLHNFNACGCNIWPRDSSAGLEGGTPSGGRRFLRLHDCIFHRLFCDRHSSGAAGLWVRVWCPDGM